MTATIADIEETLYRDTNGLDVPPCEMIYHGERCTNPSDYRVRVTCHHDSHIAFLCKRCYDALLAVGVHCKKCGDPRCRMEII